MAILNLQGEIVLRREFDVTDPNVFYQSMNVAELAPGLYFLKVSTKDLTHMRRFIKSD